ncbi:MAG: ubiquinol-cytochrome c reductase iron-sulfur subunit [Burkholderiaceae bacterium]
MTDRTDLTRRKWLTVATASVGGVGLGATALAFIETMEPSEAAKAAGAPVEVDLSGVAPGTQTTVAWRGKPVWIIHRTDEQLKLLGNHDAALVDPMSQQSEQPADCKNPTRSVKPAFFVAVGICTHLGCIPSYRPEPGAPDLAGAIGGAWPGGFSCPCHGSKFDLAGRVAKNVPAPLNLVVPQYKYLSDTKLIIGGDSA